jgi:cell division protein FtsA
MRNDFIVAIELGSSKISGIAGTKNSDGSIQVLAYCHEDSSAFIRKGKVYNIDKTAQCLSTIVNTLQFQLHCTISKVYAGIGGSAIRTIENRVPRHLDKEEVISQEIIDSIMDENISMPLPDMEILDVIPQEYKVGLNKQMDPIGILGSSVEGHFLNIVTRASVKKSLEICFEKANIDVSEYYIAPKATAEAVLSEAEKRSGCALIDFGADTTTVSIYKNNVIRFISVIPLGGNNITHDIMTEKVEEDEAESLKKEYGHAYIKIDKDEDKKDVISDYPLSDNKRTIDAMLLNEIIEARTLEIIKNVWKQIEQSGYQSELISGLIITGGASNLRDLCDAIKEQTKFTGNIKIAKTPNANIKLTWEQIPKDSTVNTLLGLLIFGKENCGEEKPVLPVIPHEPDIEDEEIEDDIKKVPDPYAEGETEIEAAQRREEERRRALKKKEKEEKEKKKQLANEINRRSKPRGPSIKNRFSSLMESLFKDTDEMDDNRDK